jgi:hypothetical protein
MKTTPLLLFAGFVLAFAICDGADSSRIQQTFAATNALSSPDHSEHVPFSFGAVRLSLDLPTIVPLPASSELPIRMDVDSLSSAPVEERLSRSTESAERVNVEAMRDYRARWKKLLDQFSPRPVPVLYPSTIERTLENTK